MNCRHCHPTVHAAAANGFCSLCVQNLYLNFQILGKFFEITAFLCFFLLPSGLSLTDIQEGLNPYSAITSFYLWGNPQSRVSVIVQIKVTVIHNQQIDVSVNAAIKGKVCFLRINPIVHTVVCFYGQMVLLCKELCNVCPKGGITAIVTAYRRPVYKYLGAGINTLKFQIDQLFVLFKFRHIKISLIPAGSPPVIITAVLSIHVIPGMGELHF